MQPLCVDLTTFLSDIEEGRLPASDWPRLCRDLGVHAFVGHGRSLLSLDPHGQGHALAQEMSKRGVIIAAVRDESTCDLFAAPSYTGAPPWTAAWWAALRNLSLGGWGASLVALQPPASPSMAAFNRVCVNLSRARYIAAEWGLRVAVSNTASGSYLGLVRDVPGTVLALDGDRLPSVPEERAAALRQALPYAALVRIMVDGSPDDRRILPAWRSLLAGFGFGGFVCVQYGGCATRDRYSAMGTAIALLRGQRVRAA
jgi:hypothetical protein